MHRHPLLWLVACVSSLTALACSDVASTGSTGTSGTGSGASTGSGPGTTGVGGTGAGLTGEWETLIDASWQLSAGSEDYWCATKTITEDTYVRAFRSLAPLGTHHTVLGRTMGGEPDGAFGCDAGTLTDRTVYASGVATDDLIFPEGVAMEITAGTQILLNLHLFNTSTSPLEGLSGILVQTLPKEEVQQKAEMIFAGTLAIIVPPMSEDQADGWCEFPSDSTVVTVWPHMHQLGTHMTVVHESGAGDVTLHDGPYAFGEQLNYPINPVLVKATERVHVYCTYNNTTNATVTFGDSSTQEMCFAGLYRYPALNDGLFCDLPL